MAKATIMTIRLPAETKTAIERAAKEDVRTVSSLAEKILTEWLREKGYLK
jgi:hypothetical protein